MRNHRTLRAWLVLGLVLCVATVTSAADPGVKDNGGFFSAQAVSQANAKLQQLRQQYGRTVNIETAGTLPNELQGKVDGNDASKSAAFAAYVQQRLYSLGGDVYIFINRSPARVEAYSREPSKSGLTTAGRDRMTKDLAGYFRNKQFDEGLANLTASLQTTFGAGPAAAPPPARAESNQPRSAPAPSPAPTPTRRESGGGMGSWLCIGFVVVLVVLFLIGRLFRGAANRQNNYPPPLPGQGGYGPPGYGQGGFGQGYGNQGGGFGRGLAGGLLGGLFGSWIGGNVFGQSHTPHQDTSDPNAGGGLFGGSSDTGGASGADFGDTSSGNDFSSGSDFGGGDSGGGGGDSGGASGSDF